MNSEAPAKPVQQEEIAPPPASPRYDHLLFNQLRWAKQVVLYALQKRKDA